MVNYHGTGRGSHIASSSVHNQRIERLWGDVYRCVCSTYHELFYSMEAIGVLDVESESDLFVLHLVFLSMINKTLKDFAHAWNLHPLRTEANWSPRKIWVNSILRRNEEPDTVPPDFGFDFNGPLPNEDIGTVDVPETVSPLNHQELQQVHLLLYHPMMHRLLVSPISFIVKNFFRICLTMVIQKMIPRTSYRSKHNKTLSLSSFHLTFLLH